MESAINALLLDAIRAPSGDNLQPWRFRLHDNILTIELIPGRDGSFYNWREYGSYIACGALIENITQLAPSFGLSLTTDFMPDPEKPIDVARITFQEALAAPEETIKNTIATRVTNRTLYKDTSLRDSLRNTLFSTKDESGLFSISLISDKNDRRKLGTAIAANEIVLFSNKKMHHGFFEFIHWEKDAGFRQKETRLGFPESTLEIDASAKPIFRLLPSWNIATLLRYLGLTKIIAHGNAKLYASGAAIGVITSRKNSLTPLEFIQFGIFFERVWLKATEEKLAFQPLMGICFLSRMINEGGEGLSPSQEKIVQNAMHSIAEICETGDNHVIGMFRIGEGLTPSGVTLRLPPVITTY